METHRFRVNEGEAGQRLDLYLVGRLPHTMSRTHLQRLIKDKKVLVNGAERKSRYNVEPGDVIEVLIPKPRKLTVAPQKMPLEIIFEDDRMLVINKPAGLVTHPAPGNYTGTLVNALVYHVKKLSMTDEARPGIVHRLDKNTSGLLVVAKDEEAHLFISRQFDGRSTEKVYLAVVDGVVELDNGVISYPIGRHPRDRKRMSVRFSEAKEAVTRYSVIQRFRAHTYLEIRPETGRTHQIRVHLAYIGHPIVSDETYGKKKKSGLIARQALHAAEISLRHPGTHEIMHFKSPLPSDMKRLIDRLKNDG